MNIGKAKRVCGLTCFKTRGSKGQKNCVSVIFIFEVYFPTDFDLKKMSLCFILYRISCTI